MKHIFLLFLLIPLLAFSVNTRDSIKVNNQKEIKYNENEIEQIRIELSTINTKLVAQDNLNERTYNSLSTQLNAASYSITIFGILFAIAAIILGIYVTRIENKVVHIKEESNKLLMETIKNKEEVVSINNLIQKDIYGLFLKIKREETNHILNRLLIVPKDITNLIDQLLSRELEKDDFEILKKAYLNLLELPVDQRGDSGLGMTYENHYKLLFFQHFMDLSTNDEIISKDLIDFYPTGIKCAFENDIIKSTTDFMKAIVESGYKTKENEINSYIKGLSNSNFKNAENVYKIFFDKLQNRNSQFGFFLTINDDKECRIGKLNYGKLLISSYSNTLLNNEEKAIINKINEIIAESNKENKEIKTTEQKENQ